MNAQPTVLDGIALGIYKAHALAGPVAALIVLLATPYWWLALMLGIGSTVGWLGWWRDFGLRWNPWRNPPPSATHPAPSVEARDDH